MFFYWQHTIVVAVVIGNGNKAQGEEVADFLNVVLLATVSPQGRL